MIEPTDRLRASLDRQKERYKLVRYITPQIAKEAYGYTNPEQYTAGWYGMCCMGCHGCSGGPISGPDPRPIDAHLARLEWLGKVPVGPVRVAEKFSPFEIACGVLDKVNDDPIIAFMLTDDPEVIAASMQSFYSQLPMDRPVFGNPNMMCTGWKTTVAGRHEFNYRQVTV